MARILAGQGADPVHKVTIVPRGRALGLTQMLPQEDQFGHTLHPDSHANRHLDGRSSCRERIVFDEFSTGAQNDLERATKLAPSAVTRYGMSELIGPRTLSSEGEVFLGRDYGKVNSYSEATGKIADEEVDRITSDGEALANTILDTNHHILEKLGPGHPRKRNG